MTGNARVLVALIAGVVTAAVVNEAVRAWLQWPALAEAGAAALAGTLAGLTVHAVLEP